VIRKVAICQVRSVLLLVQLLEIFSEYLFVVWHLLLEFFFSYQSCGALLTVLCVGHSNFLSSLRERLVFLSKKYARILSIFIYPGILNMTFSLV